MDEFGFEQLVADQLDLDAALAGLAGIVAAAVPLAGVLDHVARFAVGAIPGAEGVGVTMFEAGRADTVVASTDFVREVDDIQYALMEGPCVTAAAQTHTVRSGSLKNDPRWPQFGPRVGLMGVRSALSLPLLTGTQVVGALNVYAHEPEVFDEHAARLGELFAAPAAVAVRNAQVLEQARRLAEQLQTALVSRAVIDQALGIMMSRNGGTADEALASLRERSQATHVKVSVIAQGIVDGAVRRARAHRHNSDS